ncbi:MAG TPA: undecaprenyl-diphosphate phosphatase [Methylomirabilota bacterium]|jgi:undecaprenyl-diphosphatase|nr:undecaprenyl-diphosphate phosphatase [Methylomirabilota bacterium]
MTPLHAVVLGLVQGATEFLPISSSGHLILVPALLGWPDQGLAFDAAVHLGTALALLCYFAPELWQVAAGLLAGRVGDRRLMVALAVGTVPAALAGLALEHAVETRLRSTAVVAVTTIVGAIILWWADRQAARGRVHELRQVGVARAFGIGLAQILALIPGTSRSGITLSAGLFLALDRPTAARFAFLLGLPITAGAGLLKTAALARGGAGGEAWNVALGVGTSFAAGLAAIWFLIAYLRRRTLLAFVVYRLLLGALLLSMLVG